MSSASPQAGDPEAPTPPSKSNPIQATEQQLKARAEGVSIEDYLLPRSQTIRLAKSVLPPNTSLQKDAVLAIQKAATVFVSYLSSHANESTLKRTVTPADVFAALSELELDGFKPRLEKELALFEEAKAAKRKPRAAKGGAENGEKSEGGGVGVDNAVSGGTAGTVGEEGEGEKKEVVVRGVKRVKRGEGEVAGGGGDGEEEDDEADEVEAEVEEHDENATEEEEEDEDDEEDDEEEVPGEDEDIDRVEDLDRGSRRRMVDPDAGDDTESDDDGPGSQLRGGIGLG